MTVPAGASLALNGGTLDPAGTDVQIAGAVTLGAGDLNNAGSVAIAAGGSLDGGSGNVSLFGNWSNLGTFTAATGSVSFVDGGSTASNIAGSTTFDNVSFVSNVGKTYSFAVGSTQTIGGLLTILGTPAQGIQLKSAVAGQVANINLRPTGTQDIQHVGVSNVHATGQHLASNQTNDGGGGDAVGWFGAATGGNGGNVAPTPMMSSLNLLLLSLLVVFAAFLFRRNFPHRT
ncbi:MAG: hypothetical protein P4L92_15500 [Rudaea sp.]|nr:hypothetical protein [Rudaea sp.]